MKFFTALSTLSMLALFSNPVWAHSKNIEIISVPKQQWRFEGVTAYIEQNKTIVSGHLNSRYTAGLPDGHVDVAAYSPGNQRLAETTAAYSPAKLSHYRQKKGGVRFAAKFDQNLPADAVIKVAFHSDPGPSIAVPPSHLESIAK